MLQPAAASEQLPETQSKLPMLQTLTSLLPCRLIAAAVKVTCMPPHGGKRWSARQCRYWAPPDPRRTPLRAEVKCRATPQCKTRECC